MSKKTTIKPITQKKPHYIRTKPSYLVYIPYHSTTGEPDCPHEYNNSLHAAVHSLISAMKVDDIDSAYFWLREGRRQLTHALKALNKPGAALVPAPTKGAK